MYAIYGNMDPINIPPMLIYIYIPYMDPMGVITCFMLPLVQFVTCYQEVAPRPRGRLEVQESLVENRRRADCPRPWKISRLRKLSISLLVTVMKQSEISKHNNLITTIINNLITTRTAVSPSPSTKTSAVSCRQPPAVLRAQASEPRESIPPLHQIQQAGRRIWAWHSVARAWLRESGLVGDRLRSLAIACCDQAQVYQVWCLMVFECFWSEMMWCASKSKKHLLHSCTAPVGNPDPTLSPQSLEPSVSLKRLPKGPPYLWFLGLGVAHASHGWVMQQSIAFSIFHSIAFSLGKLSSPARSLQGRPGTLSTPIKHGAHCGEC